jgi:hypothetical protein
MSYRKARTQHHEISLCLTYSTHHSPAEKKKTISINHTATVSINYTTRVPLYSDVFMAERGDGSETRDETTTVDV